MSRIKELYKRHREIILYLTFGLLTTLVSWTVYFTVLWTWKAAAGLPANDTGSRMYIVGYTVAQILQWVSAVLFAFFADRKWVFTDADKSVSVLLQLAKFSAGRVATFFIDYLVTLLGGVALSALIQSSAELFGREVNIAEILAKLIAALIVLVCNYIISKIFVFKKKRTKS